MAKATKWTPEVIQFMIDNYKGRDNIELAELLNEKFNLNTTNKRVQNVKSNLLRRKGINLKSGINRGCIKKGNIPKNKGLKWDDYLSKEQQERSRATCFKKGNVPPNYREVGSERISVDGYIEVKTKDPNTWELKHRLVYEEKYGKISKGSIVVFLDNNRQNIDIDNLKLISRSEELIMNKNKLFTKDKDITNTGTLIAKVIDKANKLKNDK